MSDSYEPLSLAISVQKTYIHRSSNLYPNEARNLKCVVGHYSIEQREPGGGQKERSALLATVEERKHDEKEGRLEGWGYTG